MRLRVLALFVLVLPGVLQAQGTRTRSLGGGGGPLAPDVPMGEEGDSWFGRQVENVGDVDGSGLDSVMVTAPRFTVPGLASPYGNDGKLYLYSRTEGLGSGTTWTVEGTYPDAWLGWSIDGVGDVDGDGYDDVLVGSIDASPAFHREGVAQLFRGSARGLSRRASWEVAGGSILNYFGRWCSAGGDFDADGLLDVVVASSSEVRVFPGAATGLSRTPALVIPTAGGWPTARGGVDTNGDGFDDLVLSYTYDLHVHLGSPGGLSPTPAVVQPFGTGSLNTTSGLENLGDTNGDGFDDVLVSFEDFFGAVFHEVYHGSEAPGLELNLAWSRVGFGQTISPGDLDQDGLNEVVAVGSPPGSSVLNIAFGTPVTGVSSPGFDLAVEPLPNPEGADQGFFTMAGCDLNGDGEIDLALGNQSFRLEPSKASPVLGAAGFYYGPGFTLQLLRRR